jgi:hypothetical protein
MAGTVVIIRQSKRGLGLRSMGIDKMDQILAHWRTNGGQWVEYALPKLLVILLVSFVLLTLLRAITKKLVDFSKAHQIHTGMKHTRSIPGCGRNNCVHWPV